MRRRTSDWANGSERKGKNMKNVAVVLAAGQGARMRSSVPKQYLLLDGKPVLYYSLKAFQESFIDEIVLVTGSGEREYCQKEFVEKYGFGKVAAVVEGGKERYHSVYQGIKSIGGCEYLFIHDGARPFPETAILDRAYEAVKEHGACVAAVPAKDTVKISDEEGFAAYTPKRSDVWIVQTPQVFHFPLIRKAYERLMEQESELLRQGVAVTDDAMVIEHFTGTKVKMVEGSYRNIKITTPEDLQIAETLLERG